MNTEHLELHVRRTFPHGEEGSGCSFRGNGYLSFVVLQLSLLLNTCHITHTSLIYLQTDKRRETLGQIKGYTHSLGLPSPDYHTRLFLNELLVEL